MFDDINNSWISTTTEMKDARTAYLACAIPGVLDRLIMMDDKLDKYAATHRLHHHHTSSTIF